MSGWEKSINGIGRDRAGTETRAAPLLRFVFHTKEGRQVKFTRADTA